MEPLSWLREQAAWPQTVRIATLAVENGRSNGRQPELVRQVVPQSFHWLAYRSAIPACQPIWRRRLKSPHMRTA